MFHCSHCAFSANRRETLMRHTNNRHQSLEIVSSLLDIVLARAVSQDMMDAQEIMEEDNDGAEEIVSSLLAVVLARVVAQDMMDAQEIMEEEDDGAEKISAYEKARNDRIAEIQAEFVLLFPTFRKEVQELRVMRVAKKGRKRSKGNQTAPRKSSRIQEQNIQVTTLAVVEEPEFTQTGSEDEDALEAAVMVAGDSEVGEAVDMESAETEAGEVWGC